VVAVEVASANAFKEAGRRWREPVAESGKDPDVLSGRPMTPGPAPILLGCGRKSQGLLTAGDKRSLVTALLGGPATRSGFVGLYKVLQIYTSTGRYDTQGADCATAERHAGYIHIATRQPIASPDAHFLPASTASPFLHATILILGVLTISFDSILNCALRRLNVHTSSHRRYVRRWPCHPDNV
jgi:hypothetical protein